MNGRIRKGKLELILEGTRQIAWTLYLNW